MSHPTRRSNAPALAHTAHASRWLRAAGLAAIAAVVMSTWMVRAEPDAAWVARMDALSGTLSTLLPDALDPTPLDDARRTRLRGQARLVATLAHDLARVNEARRPDHDPTLPFLLRELEDSAASLERVSDDRLRDVALSAASACIACHTRSDRGGAMPRVAPPEVDPRLPLHVQADVYAATRRFREARDAYARSIGDDDLAARAPLVWERAVRRSLALEVRVARDPQAALQLVDAVLATPSGEALWPDASAWKTSLQAWSNEPRDAVETPFARGARLMNEAMQTQRAPSDASADVLLLRASAAIHDALADALVGQQRAQALAWLGIAYETLRDVDIWSLWLAYDEACIDAAPHTPLAQSCFARWERGVLEEHSGNAGLALPIDLERRRRQLRAQAGP